MAERFEDMTKEDQIDVLIGDKVKTEAEVVREKKLTAFASEVQKAREYIIKEVDTPFDKSIGEISKQKMSAREEAANKISAAILEAESDVDKIVIGDVKETIINKVISREMKEEIL